MSIFIGLLWVNFFWIEAESKPTENLLLSQNFESEFLPLSFPDDFLPAWSGNEVRETSSRIFQANGLGRNESAALAVQSIASFDGELIVRLPGSELDNPRIKFWARSRRNGSGNRPAEVFVSWGTLNSEDFIERARLGEDLEFENEDQDYREFILEVPENLSKRDSLFLKFEINYGEGAGSSARWFLDDFVYGEFEEDLSAPELISARGFDASQVQLNFSEAIDPVFAEFLINYSLDGIEPEEAKIKQDSLVLLTFGDELESGKEYALRVLQIPDGSGNFLRDTTVNFTFFDPTLIPKKALVINEIMPAPKPDLDLPNVEYVEIYHAGEHTFRLGGVSYGTTRSETFLPELWILPGEYLLLARASQAEELSDYGEVLGLEDWPSLLNSGERIFLKEDTGAEIDQLSYSPTSWMDSELANTGYSLEVVNPFLRCEQSALLVPSTAAARGTPGRQNSVLDLSPDDEPPVLVFWQFEGPRELFLRFSEPILTDFNPSSFIFSIPISIDSVLGEGPELRLLFQEDFPANEWVQMSVLNLIDCTGNEFTSDQEIDILRPAKAEIGDVLLNELLFNPQTGDPKFIELYNKTSKFLEVGSWSLANLDDAGEVDQLRQISEKSVVIPPLGFIAITTDSTKLQSRFPKSRNGNFLQINSLPSYPISGGTVVLLNSDGAKVEVFSYDEDLHHPLLRDSKGVSLERISPDSPVETAGIWQSASGTQDFGTPGKPNSQVFEDEFMEEIITINPEVFDPEGRNGQTFTTISYQLSDPGWFGTFTIYDLSGRKINVLTQNQLLGADGIFIWTGTNSQGKKMNVGYYVLLAEFYHPDSRTQVIKKTVVIGQIL